MSPTVPSGTTKRDNTTPSCTICNRRKVKCDRVYPCAPCKKTGLECSFPEPARKRARRKPPTPPAESTSGPTDTTGDSTTGESQTKHGAIHTGGNSSDVRRIWGGVGYEFVGNRDVVLEANDSTLSTLPSASASAALDQGFDLLFGHQLNLDYGVIPISPEQIAIIGNAYRNHVNPIVKVFHWNTALTCTGDGRNSKCDPVGLHLSDSTDYCLFRAVCFITAVATDGVALDGFSDIRGHALIRACRVDAERALTEVKFMKSRKIRVLQALTLYLIALQCLGENETVWMMLGVAIRTASVLGMPQDIGANAEHIGTYSPYQVEMMRRLWWAIIALDARVTRILGRTGYLSHNFNEIPRPANVDDNSLFPSMPEIPPGIAGLADSAYVRYRATLSDVLPFIYASGNAKDKCTGLIEMINDAERQIEEDFIQHCNKNVPIHVLTFVAGRGYAKRVKLALYSIFPTTDNSATQSPYASEAFWLARDSMDLFIETWTNPSLQQWQWHWKDFFGWHTLRILVQEISKRSSCSKVIEAWKLVKRAATLVVSALKLGEEKARLVGDLRMLIEAGDVRSNASAEGYAYATGSMVPSIRPGMGTNPHNAMLPGLSKSFTLDVDADLKLSEAQASSRDEYDLKKVNFAEMDRVLLQLGTYAGN